MDVVPEILIIQNKTKCQFQPKMSLYLFHCTCKRVRKEPWLTEVKVPCPKKVFFFFQFISVN